MYVAGNKPFKTGNVAFLEQYHLGRNSSKRSVIYRVPSRRRAGDLRSTGPSWCLGSQPPEVVSAPESLLRIQLAGVGVQQLCPAKLSALREHSARRNPAIRPLWQLYRPGMEDLRLDREQPRAARKRDIQERVLPELVQQCHRVVCPERPVPHVPDHRRCAPHDLDPPHLFQADL